MSNNLPEPHGRQEAIYKDTNLKVIFSVTLMAVLGVSSITPAFPRIIEAFNIPPKDVGLLITLFALPGIILTPLLGLLADRYGRKVILVPSLFVFAIAGGACSFAQDYSQLLILRFLQGVGAASLGSINITLIGDLYAGPDRTSVMGYNASVLSIGTASYPAVGGLLAMSSWKYPFLLPVLALPVGLYVLFSLRNPEPRGSESIGDYLATTWQIIKSRKVFGLFIASIATFIILFGTYLTYFPLLLGYGFNVSPVVIGLFMSTASLATAFTSARLSSLVKRFSNQALLKMAFILYATSLVLVPFATQLWMVVLPTILFGVAQGMNLPIILTMLSGLAPSEHRAGFMSINSMVFRFGQTLGPVAMGVVFGMWGIAGAFYAGAYLSVAILIVVVYVIR